MRIVYPTLLTLCILSHASSVKAQSDGIPVYYYVGPIAFAVVFCLGILYRWYRRRNHSRKAEEISRRNAEEFARHGANVQPASAQFPAYELDQMDSSQPTVHISFITINNDMSPSEEASPPLYSEVMQEQTPAAPIPFRSNAAYDPVPGIESRIKFKQDQLRSREDQLRKELRDQRERTTRGFESNKNQIRIAYENLRGETRRVEEYRAHQIKSLASSRSTTESNIYSAQRDHDVKLKALHRKREEIIKKENHLESEMRRERDDQIRKEERMEDELSRLRKDLDGLYDDLRKARN